MPGVDVTLPSLQLGCVPIDFPVVQAALAGYSDWPMRQIATRLGAPFTYAEVMLDQFVVNVSRGRRAGRYIRTIDDRPCGAQLMGSSADEFSAAALTMVDAGFDVIDINFGCPVKKVVGKCRGGYLLSRPMEALQIVDRVRDVLPPDVPLTVKMRRGMDDTPESREKFFEIFDGAFARGVAAITVHGRTVRQRYEGRCSWEFLREVKQHAGSRAVLGSGDLFTAENCLAMMAQTGVDGVTAARGAIGNPWIFRQARDLAEGRKPYEPSLAEQREVIAEHYRLCEETYGRNRSCRLMRKFGIKYARLHPEFEQVRKDFVAVTNPGDWQKVLDRWYGEGREVRG